MKDKLTDKQRLFVAEYLTDLNATQAAIRAGYSENTATEIGYENLTKPHIAEAIQEAQKLRAEKVGITAERVLQELAAIAFSKVTNYSFDDYGHVDLAEGAEKDAINAVSSIKRKTFNDKEGNSMGVETEIKLWDKNRSLEMVGKHLGMFKDKVEHSGGVVMLPLPPSPLAK